VTSVQALIRLIDTSAPMSGYDRRLMVAEVADAHGKRQARFEEVRQTEQLVETGGRMSREPQAPG
jgi:hypothetical protein